jgi:hypothetical protein
MQLVSTSVSYCTWLGYRTPNSLPRFIEGRSLLQTATRADRKNEEEDENPNQAAVTSATV